MIAWFPSTDSQAGSKHPALCPSPAAVQAQGRDTRRLHPSPEKGSAC